MKTKEKAKELVKQYYNFVSGWTTTNKPHENPSAHYEGEEMKIGRAKQCALIAVDEIINAVESFCYSPTLFNDFETGNIANADKINPSDYWQEVKQEIEKL